MNKQELISELRVSNEALSTLVRELTTIVRKVEAKDNQLTPTELVWENAAIAGITHNLLEIIRSDLTLLEEATGRPLLVLRKPLSLKQDRTELMTIRTHLIQEVVNDGEV